LIAVLADTHMPKGSRRLPERCVELIGEFWLQDRSGADSFPGHLIERTTRRVV